MSRAVDFTTVVPPRGSGMANISAEKLRSIAGSAISAAAVQAELNKRGAAAKYEAKARYDAQQAAAANQKRMLMIGAAGAALVLIYYVSKRKKK